MQTQLRASLALLLGLMLALSLGVSQGCGSSSGGPNAAAANQNGTSATTAPHGKTVVLWISVDGNRGDYVDRGQSPYLKSLMEHGLYTKQLTPQFPSLTFPSHSTEATGVQAGIHGIVSNKWFDTSIGQEYNMPSDPKLLEAEPIWTTATRQGVRTAVLDWPLSQAEDELAEGKPRADYFNKKYDPDLTDEQRLQKLVDAYRKDFEPAADAKPASGSEEAKVKPAEPLRLLMGYVHDIDSAGHKFGPEAPETDKAIHDEDAVVEKIVGEVAEIFKTHMHPEQGDVLYVLITTDHGMDDVKNLVNLHELMGGDAVPATVRGLTSGSLGNIYLNDVPGAERDAVRKAILEHVTSQPYAKAWTLPELPDQWHYGNPTRSGDIIVSLDPGYDFSSQKIANPTPATDVPKSLKGMHGYDPALDPKMQGFAVLYRWGSNEPGKDLGPVSTLQLHPTVAKLLGITPATGAAAKAIEGP
jgi:predicted AlkP superfamily pyrophosphatase or phosphodiesterase